MAPTLAVREGMRRHEVVKRIVNHVREHLGFGAAEHVYQPAEHGNGEEPECQAR
jgi:hypothetical protein